MIQYEQKRLDNIDDKILFMFFITVIFKNYVIVNVY